MKKNSKNIVPVRLGALVRAARWVPPGACWRVGEARGRASSVSTGSFMVKIHDFCVLLGVGKCKIGGGQMQKWGWANGICPRGFWYLPTAVLSTQESLGDNLGALCGEYGGVPMALE